MIARVYPPTALAALLAPVWAAAAGPATRPSPWPRVATRDPKLALARLRLQLTACPGEVADARAWHDRVRLDAGRFHPRTPHGRAARASARWWPGVGQLGECACGSSLVLVEDLDEHDDADLHAAAPAA